MTLDKFTIKAQEAVQKAQEIATARQHQAIETEHLMKGVGNIKENVPAEEAGGEHPEAFAAD